MPPSPITIHLVDTANPHEVNRFVDLPFRLYRDCPHWVPPLISDARLNLNRQKNPFYLHNDAEFFLAIRGGEDVGRVCVMNPKFYNAHKGTSHAFFTRFESIDDQAVASALLDAAAAWGHARGLTCLRGPQPFMAADGIGMLAGGFEHLPAVGLPYNFDYYPRLMDGCGFELEERIYSGHMDLDKIRADFPQRILDIADKVKERYGLASRSFTSKAAMLKWAKPRLLNIYNRTMTHIAGDPPLSDEEIDVVAEGLALIAEPQLIKFIVCKDDPDQAVGFLFCFNDISRGLQRSKGRLFPFGWIYILWDFYTTEWVNLNGIGILPEYQGLGGPAVLYAELYHNVKDRKRFKHADVTQISEFNAKSLNEMKKFGVDFYKTHHIYRKII